MAQSEVELEPQIPVWEDVVCPVCPKETAASLFIECGDRFREPKFKNYRLVRCRGCGLIYLNPRLTAQALQAAYREEGYDPFLSLQKPQRTFARAYSAARRWAHGWKKRLIRRFTPPGSLIVDGGCGTGEFLHHLREEYRVCGYEPEPNAARWARERLGLDVFTGDLSAFLASGRIAEGSVDLLTLWHVLEHVPAPKLELQRISSLLSPDGCLLLGVPNIASFDARLYGAAWAPLDAPRHLWHFTPATMVKLAGRAGFHLRRRGLMPLDPFYNSLLSEQLSSVMDPGKRWLGIARFPTAILGSLGFGLLTGNHSSVYYVLSNE